MVYRHHRSLDILQVLNLKKKKREERERKTRMSGEMWKEKNKKTSEFFQPDDAKESNIALPVLRSCG